MNFQDALKYRQQAANNPSINTNTKDFSGVTKNQKKIYAPASGSPQPTTSGGGGGSGNVQWTGKPGSWANIKSGADTLAEQMGIVQKLQGAGQWIEPGVYTHLSNQAGVDNWKDFINYTGGGSSGGGGAGVTGTGYDLSWSDVQSQDDLVTKMQQVIQAQNAGKQIEPGVYTALANQAGTNSWQEFTDYVKNNEQQFDVPTDVFPFSFNTSTSGMNWGGPVASSLLDLITNTAQQIPGIAESLPGMIQDTYGQIMQNALGPDAFQGVLNNLAAKGMIDSSVASDAMSQTAQKIMQDIGGKAFQSSIEGAEAQLNVPSLLSQIAGLDQQNQSMGLSASPLDPYQIMSSILMGA